MRTSSVQLLQKEAHLGVGWRGIGHSYEGGRPKTLAETSFCLLKTRRSCTILPACPFQALRGIEKSIHDGITDCLRSRLEKNLTILRRSVN